MEIKIELTYADDEEPMTATALTIEGAVDELYKMERSLYRDN